MSIDTLEYVGDLPDEKYWGYTMDDAAKKMYAIHKYENLEQYPLQRTNPITFEEFKENNKNKIINKWIDEMGISKRCTLPKNAKMYKPFDLKKHIIQ